MGSLLLSVLLVAVVAASMLVARRLNGSTTFVMKVSLAALLMMSLLRLYSSSSFVWGKWAGDMGLFPLFRLAVFAALTVVLIISLALLTYYWRRLREASKESK